MEWLKSTEGLIASFAVIIGSLFAGFKFLNKPNEDNNMQKYQLDGLQASISSLSTSIDTKLNIISSNQDRMLEKLNETAIKVAVTEKIIEQYGDEIKGIKESQNRINDKVLDAVSKNNNILEKLVDVLSSKK